MPLSFAIQSGATSIVASESMISKSPSLALIALMKSVYTDVILVTLMPIKREYMGSQ